MPIIRDSKDIVQETRKAMALSRADFGRLLGFTGEHIRLVEHGERVFPPNTVNAGIADPDPALRVFWLDYWMARQREDQAAIIENTCKLCSES
jgi:transcriptional regulator with XRE-family HTH domain